MKAMMDLTARSFHLRRCLDVCVSAIARLDSYERSPTARKDSPLKIRQDLMATDDIIALALNLRRFSELTNSAKRLKGKSIDIHLLSFDDTGTKLKSEKISLHSFASRVIHSKTSAMCRNVVHLFLHFDAKGIPSKLLASELGTKAAIVLDTDSKPKQFCWLREFLDGAYSYVFAVCKNDPGTIHYLETRLF